jgi:hypothetical protein
MSETNEQLGQWSTQNLAELFEERDISGSHGGKYKTESSGILRRVVS